MIDRMDDKAARSCQRTCWLLATLGGAALVLVLTQLWLYLPGKAVFVGLLAFGGLGFILEGSFCKRAVRAEPPIAPKTLAEADPAQLFDPVADAAEKPQPAAGPDPVLEPAPQSAAIAPQPRARAARKPAANKKEGARKSAPKPKSVKPVPASSLQAEPRASGLAAAMGRTKEKVADAASEPLLLLAPRDGKADDLKLIKGIGPALEKLLNEVGVWHYDQIASWKARDIAAVDSKMPTFKGRITRDEWVKQARALSSNRGAA